MNVVVKAQLAVIKTPISCLLIKERGKLEIRNKTGNKMEPEVTGKAPKLCENMCEPRHLTPPSGPRLPRTC